jgi:hypothetical protein
LLKLGTGGTWTGFNDSAPCKLVIQSLDPYPLIELHNNVSAFTSNMSISFWCKKENTTEDPYVFAIDYDAEIDTNLIANVTEDLNITVKLDAFKITFKTIIKSDIPGAVVWRLNLVLNGLVLQSIED